MEAEPPPNNNNNNYNFSNSYTSSTTGSKCPKERSKQKADLSKKHGITKKYKKIFEIRPDVLLQLISEVEEQPPSPPPNQDSVQSRVSEGTSEELVADYESNIVNNAPSNQNFDTPTFDPTLSSPSSPKNCSLSTEYLNNYFNQYCFDYQSLKPQEKMINPVGTFIHEALLIEDLDNGPQTYPTYSKLMEYEERLLPVVSLVDVGCSGGGEEPPHRRIPTMLGNGPSTVDPTIPPSMIRLILNLLRCESAPATIVSNSIIDKPFEDDDRDDVDEEPYDQCKDGCEPLPRR